MADTNLRPESPPAIETGLTVRQGTGAALELVVVLDPDDAIDLALRLIGANMAAKRVRQP